MSEDEDNQSIIDEIQALNNVLNQKKAVRNNDGASTSDISVIKQFPKFESKYVKESIEDDEDDDDDDDDDDDSSDDGDNDLVIDDCKDLQDLLELNRKLLESVTAVREKMVCLLDDCITKKEFITEQISKHSASCSLQSKIVSFNAGMPYFKDKHYFTPQRNEDTETKIKNGELRLTELQRIQRWNQADKSNLLKAISHEVQSTSLKKSESEQDADSSITKTSQLPSDVIKAIGSLYSMKLDWLKIANNMPENRHTAEECEVMWNVFLHPDINKKRWAAKEDKSLNRIVEEYEFEDWDAIALELNTQRSGYQCFVRYNTNNWKNLMKGQSWSEIDDKMLLHLVTNLKLGDYIPWGYIASCMNSWTKQQVYFRWTYSLATHLKKGRFSEEEDKLLLESVAKFGPNFGKISALVLTNRTNIQIKEHYQTLVVRRAQARKVWTIEEDRLLLELHKSYGPNWAKIVKEMPDITRIQARQRHAALMRYHRKGISFNNINRDEMPEDPMTLSTTMTYTSNSPWSLENKEIHVKHLKIDECLINFFKREKLQKKALEKKKASQPNKLIKDTRKLHDILLKFNANLNFEVGPLYEVGDVTLADRQQELLDSLQEYSVVRKLNLGDGLENVRLKMFGPQEPLGEKERFIPPLPFGFCLPRCRKLKSKSINTTLDTGEFHQMELIMELEQNVHVADYLGEDIEYQFEKLKKIMTGKPRKRERKIYSIKCKSFANQIFFIENDESDEEDNVYRRPYVKPEAMKYDWDLNRLISHEDTTSEKTIIDGVPLQIMEPNKTTLQAYQELLLISSRFPMDCVEKDTNCKLTLRGRDALYLFKKRYQQLFLMPTGLSRIIPPDIVDESAFLPALEKLKKKVRPKKRLKTKRITTKNELETDSMEYTNGQV